MKRPAFMFYPSDWRKDPELRVCSLAARGLWIDIISLMHEGEPYGHLVVNGVALTVSELARLVGESPAILRRLLGELESRNVFSRTELGVIFSRRMVRDEYIRDLRAKAGKLGGNPTLLDKRGADDLVKQKVKQKPTPSVAVTDSYADASSKEELVTRRAAPVGMPADVMFVIEHYKRRHPARRPGPKEAKVVAKALGLGYTPAELCEAIDGNAKDTWHAERGKHEMSYVLRDADHIDTARASGTVKVASQNGKFLARHVSDFSNAEADNERAMARLDRELGPEHPYAE